MQSEMDTAAVEVSPERAARRRIALIGNPNTGKTTLFNRLCGARHKTSNFPGTTQEARVGVVRGGAGIELIDLPGTYSLEIEEAEAVACRRVLAGDLMPRGEPVGAPDAVCVVLDATNLARNLSLLGEALRRRLPTVVAINRVDAARKRGIHGDEALLAEVLGCPVVVCSARTGEGVEALCAALTEARIATAGPPGDEAGLARWVEDLAVRVFDPGDAQDRLGLTDRLDRAFTHPVLGMLAFALVMTGLFWLIFKAAEYPMGWIEWFFGTLGAWVSGVMGEGILSDLLSGGVIAGVGSTLVFLPQIVLLFFLIALLEDTGYLARAAFVMDRLLRPFGLNGHSFVPLLSSHACALPGIMAARAIPDHRDRLATILVAPFMTCTARIPVYVLLVGILFPGRPGVQALAFTGGYALGVVAGLVSALVARRTVLRGKSRPMALEMPDYQRPSVRTAAITALDRGKVFLKSAGSVILAISIVLWWLGEYPKGGAGDERAAEAAGVAAPGDVVADGAGSTFIKRMGNFVQPVFEPLGYDRQLSIGVLASFAAREVFVSTMAVQVTGEEEGEGVLDRIATARRDDGTMLFTTATAWSLLVYYVLAMQCLPTLAVTAREAGGVRWAVLQFAWMSGVAYIAAMVVYWAVR